jgi:hypothetical protein
MTHSEQSTTVRILRLETRRDNLIYLLAASDIREQEKEHLQKLLLAVDAELARVSAIGKPH